MFNFHYFEGMDVDGKIESWYAVASGRFNSALGVYLEEYCVLPEWWEVLYPRTGPAS